VMSPPINAMISPSARSNTGRRCQWPCSVLILDNWYFEGQDDDVEFML